MRTLDTSGPKTTRRPYRPLREDPRYPEIKKMIEEFPAENLEELRRYLRRWTRSQAPIPMS